MARIRSIKPEAFSSESLSQVDFFIRWTFAGLWTYLDDEGYGRGDPRLIKAALFALDDDVTPRKVEKALDTLAELDSICRYEVGSKRMIHAPNWGDHQKVNRPTKTRFPRCPVHDNGTSGVVVSIHGGLTEDSLSTHGGLTGGKEQGTGNRERNGSSASGDGVLTEFDEFWTFYPRKLKRADALKSYRKARKDTEAADILEGLKRHLPGWEATELNFIPHATTWLNGERWNDQPETPKPTAVGESPAGFWDRTFQGPTNE